MDLCRGLVAGLCSVCTVVARVLASRDVSAGARVTAYKGFDFWSSKILGPRNASLGDRRTHGTSFRLVLACREKDERTSPDSQIDAQVGVRLRPKTNKRAAWGRERQPRLRGSLTSRRQQRRRRWSPVTTSFGTTRRSHMRRGASRSRRRTRR